MSLKLQDEHISGEVKMGDGGKDGGGSEANARKTDEEGVEGLWSVWDAGVDAGDEAAKTRAKDAMVVVLNKRSYLRNLVRDVNEALGV